MKNLQRQINKIQSNSTTKVLSVSSLDSNLYVEAKAKKKYLMIALLAGVILPLTSAFAGLPLNKEYISTGKPGYLWQETKSINGQQNSNSCISKYYSTVNLNPREGGTGYTSDGKFGYIVGQDLVLTLSGQANITVLGGPSRDLSLYYTDTGPVTWNGQGASDAYIEFEPGSFFAGLDGIVVASRNYTQYDGRNHTSGNITAGLYAGPHAKAGTYSVPGYSVAFGCVVPGGAITVVDNSGEFTLVKPKLECSISAPPTIDFGSVIAKGDGWVPIANRDSILNVNCSSDSADVKTIAAISFTGSPLYYGRSEMLEMTTDGSNGVGILNGRYGQGNISNCSNSDSNNADAVKFNGTVSKTLELGVGTNEIPITWTVCRRGDAQRYGNTSAQATVNVNWD